jgi:AraC-like DNA-binding protein
MRRDWNAPNGHLDKARWSSRAQILNLLVARRSVDFNVGRVGDPDAIARTAECDTRAAEIQLRSQLGEVKTTADDWIDLLALDLLNDPEHRLEDWAARHDLAFETLSRGFGKVFGVTPAAFRGEARARRALATIADGSTPLAAVAAETGFADQSHMSRAVRALTGSPPNAWRRSNSFKTADARSA